MELAKKDASEADEVSREWRAAKEMCQNLVANLHALAAPTLPAEAESQYQGWLELIGLEIGDPKEMAFISAEDYASEEDAQGRDDNSAPLEGSTQVGGDEVTVGNETDKA